MILTIDEGTTSTRALMITESGKILDFVQKEIELVFPQPGWVEQDPKQIWDLSLECCRELITKLLKGNKITKDDVEGIAITNQRETTIVWDKNTGKPIYNAINWQCKRTEKFCQTLRTQEKFANYVQKRTGLIINCYFSATKLSWILDNVVLGGEHKVEDLLFGTVDTWLIWNLTKGKKHLTDTSNASRTMLFNIDGVNWDQNILEVFNIKKSMLPDFQHSQSDFGETDLFEDLLDKKLPILSVIGDQQAAFYAYNNETKITYGTGSFVMLAFAKQEGGLLETIAYTDDKKDHYALEGSIFMGGSLVQWLRDQLEFIDNATDIENLASKANKDSNVCLIPALAGLGAPYWRDDVQGAIFGLTRASTKADIAMAALEAIVFRVKDIFSVISEAHLKKIAFINVDGGASKNDLLMQMQADILDIPVKRYSETEMTALGAAKMTGKVQVNLELEKTFIPKKSLDGKYENWKKLLKQL